MDFLWRSEIAWPVLLRPLLKHVGNFGLRVPTPKPVSGLGFSGFRVKGLGYRFVCRWPFSQS